MSLDFLNEKTLEIYFLGEGRTEIKNLLATNPKFILLDEPFAGVDPIAVEDSKI